MCRKIRIRLVVLLVVMTMGGCVQNNKSQIESAIALTKEHFKETLTIKDGPLDTAAKFSTINGFQEKRGLFGKVFDDSFIRAYVDKKTGVTSFQVYNSVYYGGRGWRIYNRVNYETLNGPESKKTIAISRDVNCSAPGYTTGCEHNEHIVFKVDEALMDTLASKYRPGIRMAWKYKLMAKAGDDFNYGVFPAEIAAILEAVNEYKQANGLSKMPQKTFFAYPPSPLTLPAY